MYIFLCFVHAFHRSFLHRCTKVPEGLFDSKIVDKHFSKFGKVVRIKLLPKKQMCIVEYDQQSSAERAVLNAGAFDGFMFDVTRTKPRV